MRIRLFTSARQWRALALAAFMAVAGARSAGAQGPWDCGDAKNEGGASSVAAALNGGTLTISGKGKMADNITFTGGAWNSSKSSVVNVVIENGVTSIGDRAFWECGRLMTIDIPESVTSIGEAAFYNCTRLGSIAIPNSVTVIKHSAFTGCEGLSSVAIPNRLDSIAMNTFNGCTGLESVAIPNSVVFIGPLAFSGCTGLKSIAIPGNAAVIGTSAFQNCGGLTSVELSVGLTTLGGSAFFNCGGLTSIAIPEGVKTIESLTFAKCTSLTSIRIPNSVTAVKYQAFSYCTALKSIVFPAGVTTFDDAVFLGCDNLKAVTFPENTASIGTGVFFNCPSLTAVISLNRYPPDITAQSFADIGGDVCLYVPPEYRGDYEKYWKNFNCVRNLDEYVSVTSTARVIPQFKPFDAAAIAPPAPLTGGFAAGPNPADRSSGAIVFFRGGSRAKSASLSIYDASGNAVNTVTIEDGAAPAQGNRPVGSWNLKDAKGRLVPTGAYLVKGTIKTADGKTEKISLVVGVR